MDELRFKLWDTDVDAQEYEGVFEGKSVHIDEGRATGAWMCGYHLNQLFATDAFRADCEAFADKFIDELAEETGASLKPCAGPAICTITVWDVDINTGEFQHRLDMEGHDTTGYHCPTAAQLAAIYIMTLIPTREFSEACFATARAAIRDIEGAIIVNDPANKAVLA